MSNIPVWCGQVRILEAERALILAKELLEARVITCLPIKDHQLYLKKSLLGIWLFLLCNFFFFLLHMQLNLNVN